METKQILMHEMDTLRQELQHLKNCQLRYFLLSITATGIIVGIASRLDNLNSAVFLSPLIVVIPCWWIFFDKASTITRIVGYYRVLEKSLLGRGTHRYFGWERSLAMFRYCQDNKLFEYDPEYKLTTREKISRILKLDASHRYWVINWYTYSILSVLCVLLGAFPLGSVNTSLALVALVFVGYSLRETLGLVVQLVFERSTYNTNESYWKQLLVYPFYVRP